MIYQKHELKTLPGTFACASRSSTVAVPVIPYDQLKIERQKQVHKKNKILF
jgi:hypothetical protein